MKGQTLSQAVPRVGIPSFGSRAGGLHGFCSGGRADLGSFASFQPMPLRTRRSAFDHAEWIFELKYDGFRALAFIEAAMPARFAQWQLVQSFPVPESRITT